LDRESELEAVFLKEGDKEKLKKIEPPKANIFFVRQQDMLGTGHAIYQAEAFTRDNPFVVAYPDDIFFCKTKPVSAQLIDAFRKTGKNVLTLKNMGDEDISRYGVLDAVLKDGYYQVKKIVEKPLPGTEPSRLVSFGRYLYTPDFFTEVAPMVQAHKQGELFQTEPINHLAARGEVIGILYEGERFDTGVPMGFLQTIIRYGLERDDLRNDIIQYMKDVLKNL
jgi:UTP--glucose-1-phosphate uridylyltransferase